MTSIDTLHDLFVDELKDLYSAEKQLVKALPKVANAATDPTLKEGILAHFEETKQHVARLETIFARLDQPAKTKTCRAMKGLLAEGEEAIDLKAPEAVRDACLIGAAQRVEHYEIAAYGTARAFAEKLGLTEVASLLQTTLDEEGAADKKLTAVASTVNESAAAAAPSSEG